MARSSYVQEVMNHSALIAHDNPCSAFHDARASQLEDDQLSVRRLIAGQYWQSNTRNEEAPW